MQINNFNYNSTIFKANQTQNTKTNQTTTNPYSKIDKLDAKEKAKFAGFTLILKILNGLAKILSKAQTIINKMLNQLLNSDTKSNNAENNKKAKEQKTVDKESTTGNQQPIAEEPTQTDQESAVEETIVEDKKEVFSEDDIKNIKKEASRILAIKDDIDQTGRQACEKGSELSRLHEDILLRSRMMQKRLKNRESFSKTFKYLIKGRIYSLGFNPYNKLIDFKTDDEKVSLIVSHENKLRMVKIENREFSDETTKIYFDDDEDTSIREIKVSNGGETCEYRYDEEECVETTYNQEKSNEHIEYKKDNDQLTVTVRDINQTSDNSNSKKQYIFKNSTLIGYKELEQNNVLKPFEVKKSIDFDEKNTAN